MTTASKNTDLFSSLDDTIAEMLSIISSVEEKDINTIPFENSWTAGQLVDHVTRSINGMAEALEMPGKIADRKPAEKANELKAVFLNFDRKMKSPPFILPTKDVYEKDSLTDKFKSATNKFLETAKTVEPSELLNLQPLGELTKLEVLYFILFHTQRHTHQLKNIAEKINH